MERLVVIGAVFMRLPFSPGQLAKDWASEIISQFFGRMAVRTIVTHWPQGAKTRMGAG